MIGFTALIHLNRNYILIRYYIWGPQFSISATEFNFLLSSGSSRVTTAWKNELLGSELLINSVDEFITCTKHVNSVLECVPDQKTEV
jgi:hypothetical protein